MTINIEYEAEAKFDFDVEKLIRDVVCQATDYVQCPYEASVEVLITDNEGIHRINNEFRQIDRPTDVLSFPMVEYEKPGDFGILESDESEVNFDPDSGELLLGDIVLSVDKIIEQSENYGHSTRREMAFLVAHSMLHLFGYDHMEEEEAKVMEAKQEEILAQLGITRD